ncbi:outer membrane protein assembly factor BamE [Novosphingobium sp.]|uniref:outer membrane protein assembly factor BamE n=1 Tax=Novosphingobium sp. TaxID=1874826 RepID=UPI0035ADECE3
MRVTVKITRGVAIGAMLVAGLSGCASIKDHRGYLVDAALLDSVAPGVDNQASVERTLGRPTFVSQFGAKDWYYVSTNTRQAAFTRPRAKDQLLIKVSFDDKGNVTAVQRSGMEKVVNLNPDGDKTPTLGRDRSFLEDLFGNIGTVGAAGMGNQGAGGPNGS